MELYIITHVVNTNSIVLCSADETASHLLVQLQKCTRRPFVSPIDGWGYSLWQYVHGAIHTITVERM